MKKLFTLVAMVFMAVGANAQAVIAEKDWAGTEIPSWYFIQFADSQTDGSAVAGDEGMVITVGTQTGELWQPQIQCMDGLFLEEDHNYQVVINAKFPTDGTLQINMGNWAGRDQFTTAVTATGDFQDVAVDFDAYAYDVFEENADTGEKTGNGFVLFQCGDFKGVTTLKSVKVIDKDAEPTGIKTLNNKAQNGVRYNLAGQKVDANYKGAVIMNGKKFIQK